MRREFLGWHKPLLERAADFLFEHHTDSQDTLNLKNVTVVLPSSRACNRLEEILASRSEQAKEKAAKNSVATSSAWYPPEFLTLESLPEKFYKQSKSLANEMTRRFAWMEAIKRLDAENPLMRKQLLPSMPAHFETLFDFARLLDKLHYELAAEGIDFVHAAHVCRRMDADRESSRWNVLAHLQKLYANDVPKGYLDEHNLWDIQAARLYAIEKQAPEEYERIRAALQKGNRQFYLVGLVDMNRLQKDILKKFDSFISCLVFAPASLKNRFDEFGCLQTKEWCDAPMEIDESLIKIVLKPEHQADTVLREIASFGNHYSSGEIIVCSPDKSITPFLQQRFAGADLPSRLIEGTPLAQTGIYRFLEVLLKFLKTRFFRDYAELVRHPDVELFLQRQFPTDNENFIAQLDRYHQACFSVFVPESWELPNHSFTELHDCWKWTKDLLELPEVGKMNQERSLVDWLTLLQTILDKLYQDRLYQDRLHQDQNGRSPIEEPLNMIVQELESMKRSLSGLPERFTFADTLQLFLSQVKSILIPPAELPGAIEIIGWLETAMEDAPVALITGMNDGTIPSFANSDIFLPDELRQELSITDNRRRYARDAYYLNILLETRKKHGKIVLIAGRHSAEEDPISPSRFFFASENVRNVSERVQQFFQEIEPSVPLRLASSLMPVCVGKHRFTFPSLPPLSEPIKKISVTALKDYKACPYRFYLQRVLHLNKVDDESLELKNNDFGTLVHQILYRFGCKDSPVRHSVSDKEIESFLCEQLSLYSREIFGASPLALVDVQIERMKNRLAAFAKWQAARRKSGYEIVEAEFNYDEIRSPILIGGIQLCGQIDRIERRDHELVVLDYKTHNDSPDQRHKNKKDGWIDFQLPLYHYILRKSHYADSQDSIRMGYMSIPKDTQRVREQVVDWSDSDIQKGIDEACQLIEDIAVCDWESVVPASKAPKSTGIYSYICHDDCIS